MRGCVKPILNIELFKCYLCVGYVPKVGKEINEPNEGALRSLVQFDLLDPRCQVNHERFNTDVLNKDLADIESVRNLDWITPNVRAYYLLGHKDIQVFILFLQKLRGFDVLVVTLSSLVLQLVIDFVSLGRYCVDVLRSLAILDSSFLINHKSNVVELVDIAHDLGLAEWCQNV